ncbi:DNA/RNA non-specific endonuclease [Brachybacterium vulturis]|uniref:DNA/RNA non-specific endonuclease n=1 Tax=Brachybacterium vulturis TaxID=2017484 RepID=UPI0012FD522A|nr:DNA/RNA non-specific endonuclease [Brachybacterium vulturis]
MADEARGAGGTSKRASETWRAPEAEQHVTWQDRIGPKQTFPPENAVLEANTSYEVPGRGTYYTDGTGAVTHVETGYSPTKYPNPDLNPPAPNTTYVVDDRHVFVTDGKSRTVEVHVPDMEQAAARRSGHIQGEVGRAAGPGHDGGHLIQNALGGGRERINIVGMLEELNRPGSKEYGTAANPYYRMEAELRTAVKGGKDVSLDLYVQYGDGKTPVSIEAEYSIEGIWKTRIFENVR